MSQPIRIFSIFAFVFVLVPITLNLKGLASSSCLNLMCRILATLDTVLMASLMFYLAGLSLYMFCRFSQSEIFQPSDSWPEHWAGPPTPRLPPPPTPPSRSTASTPPSFRWVLHFNPTISPPAWPWPSPPAPYHDHAQHDNHHDDQVRERCWVAPLLVLLPPTLAILLALPVPLGNKSKKLWFVLYSFVKQLLLPGITLLFFFKAHKKTGMTEPHMMVSMPGDGAQLCTYAPGVSPNEK